MCNFNNALTTDFDPRPPLPTTTIGHANLKSLGPKSPLQNSRFEFGGSVRDHHMYICKHKILVDFNLAVER